MAVSPSLPRQQCGRQAPREMQIAASPLLSCEPQFKSQGASGLLWDFRKCKSQSIFADSSCELSRGSALLNTDIEGVNLKHVNMIMHMLSVVNIKRHDTPSDFGTFASRQMTVFFLFVVELMHLVTAVPALHMKSLEWPPSVPLRSAHHKPTTECYGKFMGELSIKY